MNDSLDLLAPRAKGFIPSRNGGRDINGHLIIWLGDTGNGEDNRYVLLGGEFIRVCRKK